MGFVEADADGSPECLPFEDGDGKGSGDFGFFHYGYEEIDLITNNPEKVAAIEDSDIILRERIPMVIPSKSQNEAYLQVKKDVMGHLLS